MADVFRLLAVPCVSTVRRPDAVVVMVTSRNGSEYVICTLP